MWKPDLKLKSPAGPNTRREARTMAHRRRIFKGQATVATLVTLGFGLLLGGSIFISNQTVALRRDMAGLESRRECLEVQEGRLLTDYNAARKPEVIIKRGMAELGLVLPENPDLVLVCRDNREDDHEPSLARKFFSKFGGASEARAGEPNWGLVSGTMVSLTPLNSGASQSAATGNP
jgi:hypothetical protein